MTRTDYLMLSETLNSAKPAETGIAAEQWKRDCIAIAHALAEKTRAFDVALFLRNCGMQNYGNV